MNSFTMSAVGNLARNPELMTKGDVSYTRFLLVGGDYRRDEDGEARESVTALWFVAFGPMGETLARTALKGDQLIVQAHVRANNWTDKQGEKQYDHSFIVDGFRFGAPGRLKREEFDAERGEQGGLRTALRTVLLRRKADRAKDPQGVAHDSNR
jgi:single-strand DNA-binding protein